MTVDAAPQAPRRFSNSLDEAQQVANQGTGFPHPISIGHLGDAAYWLPRSHQLKILDGERILTIDAPDLRVAKHRARRALDSRP